jgi:predicted nucleic acid-binding protein
MLLTLVKLKSGSAKICMNEIFLDSNICVYWFDKSEPDKQDKALLLLKDRPFISSQVVIETFNACSRKLKLPVAVCEENTRVLCGGSRLAPIDSRVFSTALMIKSKYQFSFLDSVIAASAYHAGCNTLYTEDMRHGQIIEGTLKIVNPFLIS